MSFFSIFVDDFLNFYIKFYKGYIFMHETISIDYFVCTFFFSQPTERLLLPRAFVFCSRNEHITLKINCTKNNCQEATGLRIEVLALAVLLLLGDTLQQKHHHQQQQYSAQHQQQQDQQLFAEPPQQQQQLKPRLLQPDLCFGDYNFLPQVITK